MSGEEAKMPFTRTCKRNGKSWMMRVKLRFFQTLLVQRSRGDVLQACALKVRLPECAGTLFVTHDNLEVEVAITRGSSQTPCAETYLGSLLANSPQKRSRTTYGIDRDGGPRELFRKSDRDSSKAHT